MNDPGEIILFQTEDGQTRIDVRLVGETVWLSARDDNKVLLYATEDFKFLGEIPADSPSGIFFTPRAHRIGF